MNGEALPLIDARRRRLGTGLVVAGLAVILGAVLYLLEAANGPGRGPTEFAARRSYNQVKQDVHRTFPLALLVALGGLGLTIAGARVRGRDSTDSA